MNKRIWLAVALSVVAIIAASPFAATVQAAVDDWWPMFRHDPSHAGTSTSKGPTTNGTLWTYTTGASVHSSPAIVDGFVYVGSYDRKVYCMNATTGVLRWSYTAYEAVHSSPAVVDGRVYVASGEYTTNGHVYCLNASTGTLIWTIYLTGLDGRFAGVYSSPAVVGGFVYVGCNNGVVYCLNATTGSGVWGVRFSGSGYIVSSPAVADGRVYVGASDGWIFCKNAANGSDVWSFQTGGGVYSSPAIVGGRLYVGSVDRKVYCLNATTGVHIWNYTTGNYVDSSPAVTSDLVYVGSWDGKVYCLNATTGAFVWSYTTGAVVQSSSPAIAGGLAYIGSNDTKLYCLNTTTGSQVWSYKTGGSVVSSPSVADGVVYVGSGDGKVYAFWSPQPSTVTVLSPENKTYAVNTGIALTYSVDGITTWVGYSLDGLPNATITGNTTLPTLLDGMHSLTVYANDTLGIMGASVPVNFSIDTPPTGSITINNGDAYTGSTNVTLILNYSDPGSGVSQVQYSNDGSAWSSWENASSTKAWTLSSGDGTKTVYYQIKDNGGHISTTYSDTIILDTSTPRGSIQINHGAAYTNTTTVNLNLVAEDDGSGVSQMCFSNDWGAYSAWEPYATSKSWTLTAGDGEKTVLVKYRDQVGLIVGSYVNITLDMTKPTANAGQNQTVTVNTSFSFNGTGSTDNTGIASYLWDFGDGTTGTGVTPTHTYTNAGTYIAALAVVDLAGNRATSSATVSIIVAVPEFSSALVFVTILILVSALAVAFNRRGVIQTKNP